MERKRDQTSPLNPPGGHVVEWLKIQDSTLQVFSMLGESISRSFKQSRRHIHPAVAITWVLCELCSPGLSYGHSYSLEHE